MGNGKGNSIKFIQDDSSNYINKNECGYRIVGDEADKMYARISSSGNSPHQQRKKVLLLISLPEGKSMVSRLLGSIGIAHETLLPTKHSGNNEESLDTFAWVENQHILSRFNSFKVGSASSACDILVASPSEIVSYHCGLSASAADVIVSIDEEWSGSSQGSIESILARNFMYHGFGEDVSSSKAKPLWIKLVSDSSCERNFLFPEGIPDQAGSQDADADGLPAKKKQKRNSPS